MHIDDFHVRRVVGRRIGATRRVHGWTLHQLAERLGWPLQTLVNYEYGRRPLTVERLMALAHALECTAVSLLIEDTDAVLVLEQMLNNPQLSPQIVRFLGTLREQQPVPASTPASGH